ncbi:PAP2 superfamily protein [Lentzea jiangxiensis]|uniref:PAP2 superfamily protein n=1 Tax=Lentzea jiangxiensis TaxID=641025 RepID=A0A1H0PDC9_9PSEU|nr:PAP2 superfamily protein [Lentzea jiangxiensis]
MAAHWRSVKHRRWPVVAAAGLLFAALVYVLAVLTRAGQTIENAALRGADQDDVSETDAAWQALGQITVYSLAAAAVVITLVGVLRKRWDLAVAAVGVIVAGQVVVQALKRFVLPRPALVEVTGDYAHNSLPSGHTTIAMTVLFAAVIVVPWKWRGVMLFFVLPWATAIGQYTLTAKWHRLSDTLAADGIALAVAALAAWWLQRKGSLRPHAGPRRAGRVVLVVFWSVVAAGTFALGGVLWGLSLAREGLNADEWVIYLGAGTFASAGSLIAALTYLACWRRIA